MTDVSIAERHARLTLVATGAVFVLALVACSFLVPLHVAARPVVIVTLAALPGYGAGRIVRRALSDSFVRMLRRSRLRVRPTDRAIGSDARNRQMQIARRGFSFSLPMVFVDELDRVCIPPFVIATSEDRAIVAMVAGRFTYLLSALSDSRILKTTKADPRDQPVHDAVELVALARDEPEAALVAQHRARLDELVRAGVVAEAAIDPLGLVERDEYYEQLALGGPVPAFRTS